MCVCVCECVCVCVRERERDRERERTAFPDICMIQVFAQSEYTLKLFVKYYAQSTHPQWLNHQTRCNI